MLRALSIAFLATICTWPTNAAVADPSPFAAPADPNHPELAFNRAYSATQAGRISPPLQELVRVHSVAQAAGLPMPSLSKSTRLMLDAQDRVLVRIIADDINAILPRLTASGYLESGSRPDLRRTEGFLPITSVQTVAALQQPGIRSMAPIYRPVLNVGRVTSQADNILQADRVRTSVPTGYDGTGIRVGVLSDSYNGLGTAAAGIANGDLPSDIQVLQDYLGSDASDEGRGMLELIHDLAPGSPLAFATAYNGEIAFAANIIRLQQQAGCKVIVDDVGYFAEPMFQDGVVSQAVDTVKAAGAAYFSSAGNSGTSSYESLTYNETTISDPVDGYTTQWYNFGTVGAPDATQRITFPRFSEMIMSFQWDDPFDSAGPGVQTNLDLYFLDSTTGEIITASVDDNIALNQPVEIGYLVNFSPSPATCELMIHRISGPMPTRIKWVDFAGSISVEHATNSSTITGHPGAAGAMAVAAAAYFDHYRPESFSSRGPVTIMFTPGGTRLPQPVTREKPDIMAIDGTDTSFFPTYQGADFENNTFPNFFGTSAAAPHAAAIAALMFHRNPALTPTQVYDTLRTTADSRVGTAGFDVATGYGLINGFTAVWGPPVPASIPFVDGFESGSLSRSWELTTNVNGRVRVSDTNAPAAGSKHVLLDTFFGATVPDTNSRNELILHVNAAGLSDIVLFFKQKEFNDEDNPMSTTFTGSQDADGVALSVDGNNWVRLVSLVGANSLNNYQSFSYNLSTIAAANNMTLGSDVRIKFQQFDTSPVPSDGFAFDDVFVLSASSPPFISQQSPSVVKCDGESVTLSVTAVSIENPTYRWRKDGVDLADNGHISGAATANLTLDSVTGADIGSYSVRVANANGFATSSDISVDVTSPPLASIASPSELRCVGEDMVFAPAMSGPGPLSYQWYKDGVALGGATDATLTLTSVTTIDAGVYSVAVTNPCRTTVSDPISFVVAPPITCQPTLGFQGCPADQAVSATSPEGALVYFFPPQVIPASNRVILSSTHAPASTFPVGETTVTFTATDIQTAEVKSCSFKVTVTATIGPNGQPVYPVIANPNSGQPSGASGQQTPAVSGATCFSLGLADGLLLAAAPFVVTIVSRRSARRRCETPR